MTPEDWTSYLARKEQTSRFAGRYKSLAPSDQVQWPDNLETFLSPFEAFCARALDRNAALTRNLAKKMAEEKQAVAVLVAGGFHTDGLMEQWAREEASVLVLTPKIGPTDTAHRYLDVFAHDPIPLEKIFTGEPIALKAMCGLSLQDNFREIIDTLHFTVLGVFLKNNSDALLSLRMNTAQIQETLLGIIDNLKVHIFPLAEMDLTVQVGEGNAIALSMTAHNKSRQALFSGRPNEPPIFHMSEPHQENASIRHSTGPSPQTNRPQYSGNKRYARWPGTAIPQFVNFMTGIGISGQQRSILVRANLFQSLLVNLLFFMTVTIFDSTLVDPRILSTGVYLILSGMFSEYNRRVYQFDMDLHRWELGNIPEKGTKNLLELSEFLFNLPLLAFFYSDIKDTSIFGFWPLILVGVSVGLRVGYNLLAHNYNTRESLLNPPAPIMEETSPLIEIILGAYQDGTLKNNRKLIPEGRRAEDLEFELDRISQDTVTKILGNRTFKRTDEITDGPYTAYVSEGFPYTIKIPNQKALASIHMTETELRRQCEVAKNHMGILFAPMTIVRNFPIRSKGRFIPKSFVVVQQKLMGVPSLVEELNRTPSSHVTNPQRIFAELIAQREKQVTDFLAAMEEREITFQKPIQAETDLGILPPNKWVAHRLNGIQSLNPRAHHIVARSNNGDHSSTVWRVHDVCLEEIRTEQRKYLRTLLNGPASPKPHSILSDSTLERFLRWCGLSENNAEFWAKAIIILGIPIAETLLYGWATPTLTTFLPTTPLEAAFIPLLTGFISATAHILLWRIQGEKVFFRDFVSWWFMGTLFSSFFSMKPLNGWQGETPWILSGISHILINSAIVAGTARRLGRVLKWSWLMRLKPGSVIPPAPNIQGSGGLTPPQLLNLRRDILSLLTSDSMPLEVGGERREITYEMGYREFIITVGKGPKFDRWIDDQLAESQMHDENINPFRIIDYMKGKEISHLVTEVIIGGHSVPPKNTGAPLVNPSKESSITALCDTIRGAFESEGTEILNQSFHSRLMDQLSSHSLHNAKDGNNRPSQSLMATAAAVILFELKKYPDRSSQLLTYIKSATTFHEILAINDDVAKTNSVFKSFSIKYDEKVSFPFSEIKLKQYHQNYIHFINTNGISPKDNKESASPAIIAPIRGIGKTEESPVPDVIPLLRQSETVEKFDLNGLLLNGGQSINLDLLFRSFKVAGGRVVPQDVQAYRQFIRKKVRNTWAAPHTQDEWLSSLKTQRWEGVALPGVTLLGKSAEHYAESLRWWVLGELWLAVAGPRDWLNWRFYVVLYRERVLFRHNGGFSKQERLARAASYVALLRASENSVLQTNGKWGGTVAQKFDIDLLHGAVGTTGPEWQSILGRVYDSYNKILEQWTRVSLWGQYVQANKPAGIHIFDVDSLLLDSTYDADKQREVASGLAAVLLAFSNVNLARQVFLVTSAQGVQGSSINNVQLAERLKTKYGGVFERVKDLDLLTQEQVYGLYTREEGNAQPTIHLDPLLAHLKLVRMADSVRFWTHDASHVDRGTLPIQIISILKLAEQLQEFFKRHTFIQTFA